MAKHAAQQGRVIGNCYTCVKERRVEFLVKGGKA